MGATMLSRPPPVHEPALYRDRQIALRGLGDELTETV